MRLISRKRGFSERERIPDGEYERQRDLRGIFEKIFGPRGEGIAVVIGENGRARAPRSSVAAASRTFPIKTDTDEATREAPVDLADRHVDDGAGRTEPRADLSTQQGEKERERERFLIARYFRVSISGGCALLSSRTLNRLFFHFPTKKFSRFP